MSREQEDAVCPDCSTELTKVRARRVGKFMWWCWKCDKAVGRPQRA